MKLSWRKPTSPTNVQSCFMQWNNSCCSLKINKLAQKLNFCNHTRFPENITSFSLTPNCFSILWFETNFYIKVLVILFQVFNCGPTISLIPALQEFYSFIQAKYSAFLLIYWLNFCRKIFCTHANLLTKILLIFS